MILLEKIHHATVIKILEPQIVASKSFRLKAELKTLIDEPNIHLVLDLNNVELIDSAGMGVLISVLGKVKELNGELTIIGLSDQVREAFDLLGLNKVFKLIEETGPLEEEVSDYAE